jgi:hypothetical protein
LRVELALLGRWDFTVTVMMMGLTMAAVLAGAMAMVVAMAVAMGSAAGVAAVVAVAADRVGLTVAVAAAQAIRLTLLRDYGRHD